MQSNQNINNQYSKGRNEYSKKRNIPLDIQAILAVIRRRKHYLYHGESNPLNLEMTCLQGAYLKDVHLEGTNLRYANLEGVNLRDSHLEAASLRHANLEEAHLYGANRKSRPFFC
jgi:uncharacterized protein YjbI with pentapeptide repeats